MIQTASSPLQVKLQKTAVVIALAVPLCLVLGRAVADIAMGVVSLLFLASCVVDKKWTWTKTPWFLLALVTCGSLLLSGALSDFERGDGIVKALAWLRFPLFTMAFVTWLLPHDMTRRFLMPSLIIVLLLVALDAMVQFFFGTSLTGHVRPDYAGRLTGPFSSMVVGLYTSRLAWPAIGFVFAWALLRDDKKRLLWPLLLAFVLGTTVLLSGERMAFGVFCLTAVFFWLGAKQLRGALLGIAMIAVLSVGAMIWLTPVLKLRFVTATMPVLEHLGESPYGAVWHNGVVAWRYAPVLGNGLGNFVPMCEKLGKEGGFVNELPTIEGLQCVRHPHNLYLEWLAEAGLVGLMLFIGLLGMWGRQIWSVLRDKTQSLSRYYAHLGCAVGLVPFLWPLMASMSFFSNWSATLFWWVLGLALYGGQKIKEST